MAKDSAAGIEIGKLFHQLGTVQEKANIRHLEFYASGYWQPVQADEERCDVGFLQLIQDHSRSSILGNSCTMAEYNKLKSMLLDMQPRTSTDGQANAMDQRKILVDTMFKYIDRNQDGRLSSEELAEISIKEHLENILLECTMQDLLRYDDYNNDGHLTLQELYTAFHGHKPPLSLPMLSCPVLHPLWPNGKSQLSSRIKSAMRSVMRATM
ncbi:follistatin-related protein 5-like [Sinocyclocheilus grahami]|uniref:follistatin-related protein 5-like n=1 Tax=Sinocyclocheilus grahami TaxID=75366 RepID=UPI0007ACB141|nr:PREDICTED: follistatin-related protein 5-like [Sinocyclocheilus grahami]